MMRTSRMLRAALVSPAVPCNSAANGLQMVNRILGRTNQGSTCAKSFGDILAKNSSGKTAVYAHLGRAMVFLNRGEDKLALFDVENAAKVAGGDNAGKRLIASLKFQCAVRLLAEEQRKTTISGATTEVDIADKIASVKAALEGMSDAVGMDYGVSLAAGEFYLYFVRDAAAAEGHFATALKLAELDANPSVPSVGDAAPEALAAADVDVSTAELPSGLASKNISASQVVASGNGLNGLRAMFGEGLSDAQLTLLGSVCACESRGGAIIDAVNSGSDNYGPWLSEKSSSVAQRVAQVCHPLVHDHHVAVQKPARGFHMEGVSVSDVVKGCPADKHILDHVGAVPRSATHQEDEEFFKAFEALEAATEHAVPAEQSAAARYYTDLARDLMEQVAFRAKVGRAEALTQLGKNAEAESLLESVEVLDNYVDMWRLLAAKGAVKRALGKVDEADATFQKLHTLKHQQPGRDLPLMDENRHKSAF